MNIDHILICPVCKEEYGPALACAGGSALRRGRCGTDYFVVDGIINLEKNEDLDTKLDIDAYERQNKFDEAKSSEL